MEVRRLLEEKFRQLAVTSSEFGDLMRQLVPEFTVYLVRLCDGGYLLPRARGKLALASIIPDADQVPGVNELLARELTLDLFEPPQWEQIRDQAARLAAAGLDQRAIARQLPGTPTQTALDRIMWEQGRDTPYVVVTGPPPDYPKLRRHRNAKYRFEPAKGYERPEI